MADGGGGDGPKPIPRESDGSFTLQIKTLSDQLISINGCRDTTTIGEVKQRVLASDGIAIDTQKFVFSRDGVKTISVYKSKADDAKTLSDVGLPLLSGRYVLLQLQASGAGEKKVAPKKLVKPTDDANGGAAGSDATGGGAGGGGGGAAAGGGGGGGDRCPCVIM